MSRLDEITKRWKHAYIGRRVTMSPYQSDYWGRREQRYAKLIERITGEKPKPLPASEVVEQW